MLERLNLSTAGKLKKQDLILALITGLAAGVLAIGFVNNPILLVGLVALVLVAAAVMNAELGLLMLVFLTYTRLSDVAIDYHGAPSVAKFFVVVLLIGVLMRWVVQGEKPQNWVGSALLLGGYGAVGAATVMWAGDPDRVLAASFDYAKDVAIGIAVVILLQRPVIFRWVIWTLLAAGTFMGSITTYQYLTGSFGNNFGGFAQAPLLQIAGEIHSPRVAGPIGDPNFYGQIMVTLVPLALERIWHERKLLFRLLAGLAFITLNLTVILTYSRGAFLTLAFVLVAMFIYRRPNILALGATLALGLVLFRFIPAEYTTRLTTLTELLPSSSSSGIEAEPSFRGRASELIVAWDMFRTHPIFGVGLENYNYYYQDYSQAVGLDKRVEERSAHNLYLEVAAETGLLGLFFFGLILVSAFTGIVHSWKLVKATGNTDLMHMIAAYGIALAGYMFAGSFIHNAYPRFLWLLIGIALALPQVAARAQGWRRVQ